ncbi:hypothetical protein CVT24_006394 [Panaeolus cyanescens]|uniref:Arrestin-like N-terminal domain-containing protein n=1 Tax=Panaeolus cyanescens TaxID=181874 RepID=A0A409WZH8_9AGAR|nr:hypothetical protein CVT24_006394 [Panaeolus cyanescens]
MEYNHHINTCVSHLPSNVQRNRSYKLKSRRPHTGSPIETSQESESPASTDTSLPTYTSRGRGLESVFEKRGSVKPIVLRSSYISTSHSKGGAQLRDSRQDEVYTHSQSVRGSKPWVTLHMYTPKSRVSRRPTLPQAYGGQPFEGVIEINADKPVSIQEIKLTVKGKLILGASSDASSTFLHLSIPLWPNPKDSANCNGKKSTSSGSSSKTRFTGYHAFPFSFTFPTEINATSNASDLDPLSIPTAEIRQRHQLQYRYRDWDWIISGLTYIPTVIPPPLPTGLRLAYDVKSTGLAEFDDYGVVVPSPIADPRIWYALPKLYIAKPLSYNRGTHIPLFLSISSDDSRILNTLCTPHTPRI